MIFQKGTPSPVVNGSRWPWAMAHQAWESMAKSLVNAYRPYWTVLKASIPINWAARSPHPTRHTHRGTIRSAAPATGASRSPVPATWP